MSIVSSLIGFVAVVSITGYMGNEVVTMATDYYSNQQATYKAAMRGDFARIGRNPSMAQIAPVSKPWP